MTSQTNQKKPFISALLIISWTFTLRIFSLPSFSDSAILEMPADADALMFSRHIDRPGALAHYTIRRIAAEAKSSRGNLRPPFSALLAGEGGRERENWTRGGWGDEGMNAGERVTPVTEQLNVFLQYGVNGH